MNLKRSILTASFLLLITASGFAQLGDSPADDKIEAFKIGFLTKKLNLSSDQAKVFWPIYNAYTDELKKLRQDRRNEITNAKINFDSMSDSEIEKVVDDEIVFRSDELEIMRKYIPQFKTVLPIKKVAIFLKAEDEFKAELIKRIREKREGN